VKRAGSNVISRQVKNRSTGTARGVSRAGRGSRGRVVSRVEGRRLTRWSGATLAALLAVLFIFGDALLTVEVHKVSLEADVLRKRLERIRLDLGTLESEWASRSSRMELEERALELGLVVPKPDQVVLLPSAFLEEVSEGQLPESAKLRRAFVDNWMRLNSVGIP
jgi:hypothetical protein